MKKLIVFIFCGLLFINRVTAQETFHEGTVTVALTLGPPYYYGYGYGAGGGIAIAATGHYGIKQVGPGVISAGGQFGWSTFASTSGYDYHVSNTVVAGHAGYHYDWKVKKLDTYAGIATGLRFVNEDWETVTGFDNKSTLVYFAGFVGGSYFFTPLFGVNAELGYGLSFFRGGVIFKFGKDK